MHCNSTHFICFPVTIMEDLMEGELDTTFDWKEGLYEFSFLVTEEKPETDEMGRITMHGYYEILSEKYNFLATFKQIERDRKLNDIFIKEEEMNDLFDF